MESHDLGVTREGTRNAEADLNESWPGRKRALVVPAQLVAQKPAIELVFDGEIREIAHIQEATAEKLVLEPRPEPMSQWMHPSW